MFANGVSHELHDGRGHSHIWADCGYQTQIIQMINGCEIHSLRIVVTADVRVQLCKTIYSNLI